MIAALLMLAAAPAATAESCGDLPQQPMNRCFVRTYEQADAALNAQWKTTAAVMKERDRGIDRSYDHQPGYFETLLAAQRAWLTYRDEHCLGVGFGARGGSLAPTLVALCKAELTNERTRQLKAMVEAEN